MSPSSIPLFLEMFSCSGSSLKMFLEKNKIISTNRFCFLKKKMKLRIFFTWCTLVSPLNLKAGIPPCKLITVWNGVTVRIVHYAQMYSPELFKSHFAEDLLSQQWKSEVYMWTVAHCLWPCLLSLRQEWQPCQKLVSCTVTCQNLLTDVFALAEPLQELAFKAMDWYYPCLFWASESQALQFLCLVR